MSKNINQGILYTIFFLSGIAGLGYEILWTRMLSVSLGHEIVSVLAVVSAFFGGLALGAWFFDRPVSRSAKPRIWYCSFELVIGFWALVLILVIPKLNPLVSSIIGTEPTALKHWLISFLYPFLLLLPATTAMGATLPAMDRFFSQSQGRESVAGLYSVNIFGAMAGTFLTTFFIVPSLGMNKASILFACINFLGATVVLLLKHSKKPVVSPTKSVSTNPLSAPRIYFILFATGLLGIGFEVLMIRALSQILENTVFSFASILITFLFGTAIGAAIYQGTTRKINFKKTLDLFLNVTALACLASVFMLRYAEPLFLYFQSRLEGGFWAAVISELAVSFLFFILPTASMGATFSHLVRSLKQPDGGVGRALCLNTFGSASASLLIGTLLLPAVGIKIALLIVALGYLLLLTRLKQGSLMPAALPLTAAVHIAINPYSYQFVSLSGGDTVVDHRQGVMASVSVVKDQSDAVHLKVNNHFQMGGTTSVFSDRRQGLLPILLHHAPEKALFLGLGTGATFASVAGYPGLEADGVELIPEVIDVMNHFEEITGDLSTFDNLHIIAADARRYVISTDKKYDVVIADLFHPSRDGAGSLYTIEHFNAIRNILSEGGLFCQWLPLYQLDLSMLKVVTRTFLQAFPDGQAYLGHYSLDYPIIALIGGTKPLRFPENWYTKHIRNKGLDRMASAYGYDSTYSMLGTFLAGSADLNKFAGDSPINKDTQPVVLFQAPHIVYGRPESPQEILLTLVKTFSPANPESVLTEVVTEEDMFARERLAAYWSARDSFLHVGKDVEQTRNVMNLYETISEPLLKVVKKSVDFSAAYYPLLSMAYDLYPLDREASLSLFKKLERANPMRHEAGLLRRKIFIN